MQPHGYFTERRLNICLRLNFALILSATVMSQSASAAEKEGHGPSSTGFPSHDFQWRGRSYAPQLNVHFGLSQPILFRGFNIAADFRYQRWVFEYSHGIALDYNTTAHVEDRFVGSTGADLDSPWTTGFGIGFNLIDDLYLMAEFKAHRYQLSLNGEEEAYTTISVGPALAYRFFIWRGLNLTTYLRFWPNVWDSAPDDLSLSGESFEPVDLGFFFNFSLGWAFDL